jgi:hypothetical protein
MMPFIKSSRSFLYLGLLGMAFAAPPAWSAYRVYQYVITAAQPSKPPLAFLDTSTLPPTAYQAYHGSTLIQVDLLRSWPCHGDTSRRPYCLAPGDQSIARPEAAAPGDLL